MEQVEKNEDFFTRLMEAQNEGAKEKEYNSYSGTSNNGYLCETATPWSAASGKSPYQNYVQTLIKNLPTAIISDQRPNDLLILFLCLILPLYLFTFCNQIF